jgi:uncharacterized repeat protein (TIGR02543 family)
MSVDEKDNNTGNPTNWVCQNYNGSRVNKCAYGYYYYTESINISLNFYNGGSLLNTITIASSRTRYDHYEWYFSEQGKPARGWGASNPFNSYGSTDSRNFTLAAVPVLAGYTYKWDTNSSATVGTYNAGAVISLSNSTNIYAIAQANSYNATYDANNGNSTPAQATVKYDANYTLPAAISRTGYTFNGWKTGTESNRAASANFTWKYTVNTTFTAQWTANSYNATYDANNGTSTPAQATVNYGANYTLPAAISRTGYTFNGWKTGTESNRAASASFTWNYTVNTTFTAQWTVNSYNATYDANNGTSTPAQATVNYGANYTLPAAISRTGYTFNGWKTGTESNRAASASFTWNYSVNTTFTAQWTANSYTLTYNLDGGIITNNPTTVTYNASYDLKIPEKTNYTFNGWYSDSNKTTLIVTTGTWQLTDVNNIYAKFTINGFNLIFNTNGIGTTLGTGGTKTNSLVTPGSILTTQTTPSILIPKAVGYTFNGWYDAITGGTKKINNDGGGGYTMPAGATTLYAQWTNNTQIKLSDLQTTYGNIANATISLSEYQPTLVIATNSRTSFFTNLKGKGPAI